MKKIYLHQIENQIARHRTIRDINKQIVLNLVRARSPISRAEIARETSLQRSTVSTIVERLQEENLIEETGTGNSTGGRKPTLLKLKTGMPVAIGVDVSPKETNVVAADLAGNILSSEQFPTSSDVGYMDKQILSKVTGVIDSNPNADLEIGISVPGIAEPTNDNVIYIPYFQLSNWDIGKKLKKATGLNVVIDNDANAVALAELWLGLDKIRRTRNFITVMVAEGIGTGIIIDGQVYRGEDGAAGEFGHMFLAENAAVDCSCGRRDCWEAHASEKAILARYRAKNGNGSAESLDFEHFIGLAMNGEARAAGVLKEAARALGIGISNLIIGFSPKVIIVSGSIVKAWDLIADDLRSFGERSIRREIDGAEIIPSTLGDKPTILGAVSLVLARKFASAS